MDKEELLKDELITDCLGTWLNQSKETVITISKDELFVSVNDKLVDSRLIHLHWIENKVWIDSEYTVISGNRDRLKIGRTNFVNGAYEWVLDFEKIMPIAL
jgi:hypothetical protein